MIILLTIFQYFIQASVDLMDKFLISTRKIEPFSYTFYTVVMGLIMLVIWPWVYVGLSIHGVFWNLFSGVVFSLAMFVFFKALSEGEVSRVVPFIFGLVPIFDILISLFTGHNSLKISEFAAACILIPGALLISHNKGDRWLRHAGLKTLSAVLFSTYFAIWHHASQNGAVLNNLMWNRLGAAAALLVLLVFPVLRKKVFSFGHIQNKKQTSVLFFIKQFVGGSNFVFLSYLFSVGKVPLINSLQGFRYVFLLLLGLFFTKRHGHIISEEHNKLIFTQKSFGIILIFIGTALLFI